jgi:hypothetical protein
MLSTAGIFHFSGLFQSKFFQSEKFGCGVPILNEKIIWMKQKE